MKTYATVYALALCAVLGFGAEASGREARRPRVLFDDFSYTHRRELARNGWIVRTAPGWPGIPGAT
ncbi:MAG TPA: hypothetical protein VF611_19170, partial [Pyrinomonadaceae bacterium]